MKRTAFLIVLVMGFCSVQAHAWSVPIHMAVVELALDQLPDAKARQFNDIAYDLVSKFDEQRRLDLLHQYRGTSFAAQVSALPDWDRDIPLGKLFAKYGAKVPQSLQDLSDQGTAAWHYINRPLPSTSPAPQCSPPAKVNLVTVLPRLISAYRASSDNEQKALLLAFIEHLVADAHQPLHNVTRVDANCNGDHGGNDFCVSDRTAVERCTQSLHQLWDDAVGLFPSDETVAQMAHKLGLVKTDKDKATDLDVQDWSDESYNLGRLVYSTSLDEVPDEAYLEDGKAIAADRLNLAAMRLGNILKSL